MNTPSAQDGGIKIHSIKRVPEDERWDGGMVEAMRGTPWRQIPRMGGHKAAGGTNERGEGDHEVWLDEEVVPAIDGDEIGDAVPAPAHPIKSRAFHVTRGLSSEVWQGQ